MGYSKGAAYKGRLYRIDSSQNGTKWNLQNEGWILQGSGVHKVQANLNSSLRKTCNNLKDKASVNNAAVIHDRKLCPPVINSRVTAVLPYPRWDGSESQRLLKLDVNDGMHKRMVPCKLRDTRDEYRFFPLDVLGKHIHQEVRSRRKTAYWLVKDK